MMLYPIADASHPELILCYSTFSFLPVASSAANIVMGFSHGGFLLSQISEFR